MAAVFRIQLEASLHIQDVQPDQVVFSTDVDGPLCGTVFARAELNSLLLVVLAPRAIVVAHWNYLERTNDAIMKTVQRLVGHIKRKKPKHILHHRSTYIFYPSDYLDATAGPLDKLDVGLLTLGLPPARRTNYQSSGATPFCVSAVYNAPQLHPRLWSGGQDVTQMTASTRLWARWVRPDNREEWHYMDIQLTECSIMPDEMILFSIPEAPNGQWVLNRDHGRASGWIEQTYAWGEGLIDGSTKVTSRLKLHWDLLPSEDDGTEDWRARESHMRERVTTYEWM
ncbi:hypothetical protein LTR09_006296 [Extremus antarcticus]|uniref:Uncharacterized protein n=1 Tax=Extremus antarcticus TaxID=702011 RepID=A0AAJ0GDK2_9PEZI|nr:hypothetical protein LTR09_006296 [Extremus antarcticus]